MTQNWESTNLKLLTIKQVIINQSKRAIKRDVPRGELVRNEIRDNLVELFNDFTLTAAFSWNSLDELQKEIVKNNFTKIRDRIVRAFQLLGVRYKVPLSCVLPIDPLICEDNADEMAMSVIDFFNLASKLLPSEFDGSSHKLQSFLDGITLLSHNSTDHEANAVAYVKTRLTGKARDLITTEATLNAIKTTLKDGIKGENSRLLSAKLLNLKQNSKEAQSYAEEIESITAKLKRAFISEGVPHAVAETYSTEAAVRSLCQNANSEKAKLIMEAGTFSTVQEAVTKFVSCSSTINPRNSNVLHFRHNRRGVNHFNNRGRGQSFYSNNSSRWQQSRGRRGRSNTNNFNRYANYRSGSSRSDPRSVRTFERDEHQGNQSDPQRVRLGEM